MRKLLSIAAAAAAIFTMVSAQATIITLDDFTNPTVNGPDSKIFAASTAASVTAVTGGGIAPGGRTVTHTLLTNVDNSAADFSKVLVGNQAFPVGTLSIQNADNIGSQVDVSWKLSSLITNAIDLSGPVSFFFDIVGSDGTAKNVQYALASGGPYFNLLTNYSTQVAFPSCSASQLLNGCVNAPVHVEVPLSFLAAQDIKNSGDFFLRFTGDAGFDFTVDSLGFSTPEPTSLALVGLALVGAGVVARRRKA
jgi:hypothetical protein